MSVCLLCPLEKALGEVEIEGLDRENFTDSSSYEGHCAKNQSLSLLGYPESPYSQRLASNLEYWMQERKCPFDQLPQMDLLQEDRHSRSYEEAEKLLLKQDPEALKHLSDEEIKTMLVDILSSFGLRGILDLLGLRNTAGSANIVPPRREVLLESFQKRHSPKAKLTVGARALSKHCHRDGSNQWWGKCTGGEEAKNSSALAIAEKILNNAVWINSHTMVHKTSVLEVRNLEGYGLRWEYIEPDFRNVEFRGFLEPQMKDGHDVKWRH